MYGGKKLRQLRQYLGLSQGDLANELNISQPYYSAIESGKKQITNKILEQIFSKWKIDKDYFNTNNTTQIHEYLDIIIGGKNGGICGEISPNDKMLLNKASKNFPKMGFLFKSVEDLKKTHPELMRLHYNISNLAALLTDAEKIYITYLDSAINEDFESKSYNEYRGKFISHLEKYTQYETMITPLIESLQKFILEFYPLDTNEVIIHYIDELNTK